MYGTAERVDTRSTCVAESGGIRHQGSPTDIYEEADRLAKGNTGLCGSPAKSGAGIKREKSVLCSLNEDRKAMGKRKSGVWG